MFENLPAIAIGVSSLALIIYLRYLEWKKEKASSVPRPTADSVPLGPGITFIVPRTISAAMPSHLGMGNQKYKAKVRGLYMQTFELSPPQLLAQDSTWDEWLEMNPPWKRVCRDLVELLRIDVSNNFKARAIVILLAPALKFSPFEWNSEDELDRNYLGNDRIDCTSLPQQLQLFIAQLLLVNVDAVISTGFNEKLYDTLFAYNRGILQMLAILPEDEPLAGELFKRYFLNDPVAFSGMEDSSGYNPFQELMGCDNISEKYKWLADRKMQEIVRAEEEGWAAPRHHWENALKCYVCILGSNLFKKVFPYGVELFAEQVTFVLSLPNIKNRALFECHHLGKMFDILSDDSYKHLRHCIARYVVLENDDVSHGMFRVSSDEAREVSRRILEEFGTEDGALRMRIECLLLEYEERKRLTQSQNAEEQQRVNSIISKMK
jgi:hypothetical protein